MITIPGVKGYFEAARSVVLEMQRQAGDIIMDRNGVAVKGLIIRHLVLPSGLWDRGGHEVYSKGSVREYLCKHNGPIQALFQGLRISRGYRDG